MTPWDLQADEFVSCNCAYGCPCQFNALPTTSKSTGPVEMSFKDSYAQFAHIHLNNYGIVKSAAA